MNIIDDLQNFSDAMKKNVVVVKKIMSLTLVYNSLYGISL